MAKIIAIAMQKGGVGKTTTTINLAAALQSAGKRVLVVDLDPQGNLTQHIGADPELLEITIYNALKAEVDGELGDLEDAIYDTEEGFHIIPAQPELSVIELGLQNVLSRERVLETLLRPFEDTYDYILIDCNPSLGLLVINALTAADSVVIPLQTEYLAAKGASMLLKTIERIRQRGLNPGLKVEGIILTMADQRTLLTREVQEAVHQQWGDDYNIYEHVIKRSVRFAESAVNGQSLIAYSPRSQGARAYKAIAKEIISNE